MKVLSRRAIRVIRLKVLYRFHKAEAKRLKKMLESFQ